MDANTLIFIWGTIAAALSIPDWKFVIRFWDIFALAFAGGYLLGSIPFGLILTRLGGLGDIRKVGSGNIGATNVLRTGNKGLAALTLLLDGGKGALVSAVTFRLYGPDITYFASLAVVLGHMFPVWLGFRGGKGMATTFGVLLGLAWPAGLAGLATWLVVAAIFRYSSLAALAATGLAPVYAWFLDDPQAGGLMIILAVLIYLRHAANIRRLFAGTESKIRLSKSRET